MRTSIQSSLPGRTPLFKAGRRPARRPEQRRADQSGDDLCDELLTAEEERRVDDLEGGEPFEWTHYRRFAVANQRGALTCGVKRDDVAGQLDFHRTQLVSAGRGPPGDCADSSCRLAPGPLTRELVDAGRYADAGVKQPLDGQVSLEVSRGVAKGDSANGLRVKRREG
jgi:hypothetical protein